MSNQARFLELFLANEADLKAFIRSLVRDRTDSDDVFQTVAMRLLEKFDSYDPARPFGPWSRGVAAKEVLAMRRASGRCPTPFSPEVVARIHDSFESSLAPAASDPRSEALGRCVQALPEHSRNMLGLRYRESLSLAEIAQRLDRTTAAAQRALSRIRQQLAECIERALSIERGDA